MEIDIAFGLTESQERDLAQQPAPEGPLHLPDGHLFFEPDPELQFEDIEKLVHWRQLTDEGRKESASGDHQRATTTMPSDKAAAKPSRFATATDTDLERQVNKNTMKATNRDVKSLTAWAAEKGYTMEDGSPFDIRKMDKPQLAKYLALHFAELRNEDGGLYCRSTLDAKKNSILRYLRDHYNDAPPDAKPSYGEDICFSHSWAKPIVTALNNAMQKAAKQGPAEGANRARFLEAESLKRIMESLRRDPVTGNVLEELDITTMRGDRYNTFKFLVTNLQVMNRGGEEQSALDMAMFTPDVRDGQDVLIFDKGVNKTWNGGAGAGAKPDGIVIWPNTIDPTLCLVRLLKKEQTWRREHMPELAAKLKEKPDYFLQPKPMKSKGAGGKADKGSKGDMVYHVATYNGQVVGKNEVAGYMKQLCKWGNVEETTNHAVRRTGITTMLQTGASVKAVQAVTGHRSVDGVMAYPDLRKLGEVGLLEEEVIVRQHRLALLQQQQQAMLFYEQQQQQQATAAAVAAAHLHRQQQQHQQLLMAAGAMSVGGVGFGGAASLGLGMGMGAAGMGVGLVGATGMGMGAGGMSLSGASMGLTVPGALRGMGITGAASMGMGGVAGMGLTPSAMGMRLGGIGGYPMGL